MIVYHHWSVEWHPRHDPLPICRASCVSPGARSPIRLLDPGRSLRMSTARCVTGIWLRPAALVITVLAMRSRGAFWLSLTMRMAMRRTVRGAMIRSMSPVVGSCAG